MGPKEWSDFVHVICEGWASYAVRLSDGRRQILSFLLPGDMASITNLFEPSSGHALEAITDVSYRRFKWRDIRDELCKAPGLFEKIARVWIEERAQADQLAVDLGRRTARERIARQILNLLERLTKRGMVCAQTMPFPLRQRQLADASGLTPVHVSKVLGDFQEENLLDIHDRSLTVLDRQELQRVAECG